MDRDLRTEPLLRERYRDFLEGLYVSTATVLGMAYGRLIVGRVPDGAWPYRCSR